MTATPDAKPRGTRLPRLARRRQLLSAAQEVFVENGYHAAAMDEIAERAGVSKPVLYQHFPGKLELYLALLDLHVDDMVTRCREALASTHENKLRVQATFSAFFDFVSTQGEAFRLVFESDLRNVAPVRQRVERSLQRVRRDGQRGDPGGHRLHQRRGPPARRRAGRHGRGERPLLGDHARAPSPRTPPSSSWPGWPGAASAVFRVRLKPVRWARSTCVFPAVRAATMG